MIGMLLYDGGGSGSGDFGGISSLATPVAPLNNNRPPILTNIRYGLRAVIIL